MLWWHTCIMFIYKPLELKLWFFSAEKQNFFSEFTCKVTATNKHHKHHGCSVSLISGNWSLSRTQSNVQFIHASTCLQHMPTCIITCVFMFQIVLDDTLQTCSETPHSSWAHLVTTTYAAAVPNASITRTNITLSKLLQKTKFSHMLDAKFRLIRHEFATNATSATQETRKQRYGQAAAPS